MMSVEKTLDSNNITRINDNDRQFVFIGTAHVSPKSAEEVKFLKRNVPILFV